MIWVLNAAGLAWVGVAAWRGLRRGPLLTLLAVLGWGAAYLAAYLHGPVLGRRLHALTGLSQVVSLLLAGVVAFTVVAALWRVALEALRRARRLLDDATPPHPLVQWIRHTGGALAGALLGLVLLIPAVWLYSVVRVAPWAQAWPSSAGSVPGNLSRQGIRRAAQPPLARRLQPEAADRLSDWISRPDEAAEWIRRMLDRPAFQELTTSESFRDAILTGYPPAIQNNEALRNVFEDDVVIESLYALGLLDDPGRVEALLEEVSRPLARMGGRLDAVLEDPEFSTAIASWQQEELLTAARLPRLFMDPRLPRLLDRLLAPEEDEPGQP